MTTVNVNELLDDREKIHGSFVRNALTSQILKCDMRTTKNWGELEVDQKEALEMIAHKIARILNGHDVSYVDHWVDMAGYATLVVNRMNKE